MPRQSRPVTPLVARADWGADAVRDDLIGYLKEHPGHPDGVLVVDETGFVKKGCSVETLGGAAASNVA
jgi:SRSO17 transposase